MTFGVLNLDRSYLRVFLFLVPTEAAIGEADNADDDENDAYYSSWFHEADATAVDGR